MESFDWSADGRALAFTARLRERSRCGTVEGLDAAAEAPRLITGIRWHANGLGYLADRPAQLFLVAAPDVDGGPFYEPAPGNSMEEGGHREEAARSGMRTAAHAPLGVSGSDAVFLGGGEVLTCSTRSSPTGATCARA